MARIERLSTEAKCIRAFLATHAERRSEKGAIRKSNVTDNYKGVTVEMEDRRKNYGEKRIICFGVLAGRLVVAGYTPRGADRHVFSMRKANGREKTRIAPLLGL